MTAIVTCPQCQAKTEVQMPVNACLPFFKCSGCGKMIGTPEGSPSCCVVCAYSDGKCPVSTVK